MTIIPYLLITGIIAYLFSDDPTDIFDTGYDLPKPIKVISPLDFDEGEG